MNIVRWVTCLLLSIWILGPATATAGLPQAPSSSRPAASASATETSRSAHDEGARYADREAAELEDFQGGRNVGIYIGGSALTIALLIVLLIVLL